MEVTLTKTLHGFPPGDPKTQEWFDKLKLGDAVHGKFRKYRNVKFHRKYFALLNIAFDHWEPGQIDSKHGVPEKNFDRFRADLTILAGFFENTIRLDGSVRIEPKSISFAKMDADEFERLYNKTIDVLIKRVYNYKLSREEIDGLVEQYLRFA